MQEVSPSNNIFSFLGNDRFIKIANGFALAFVGCEITAIMVIIDMTINKILHP